MRCDKAWTSVTIEIIVASGRLGAGMNADDDLLCLLVKLQGQLQLPYVPIDKKQQGFMK